MSRKGSRAVRIIERGLFIVVARGSRKRGSCRGQGIRLISDTIHYSWYCTANLPFRLIVRCIFASLSFIALPLTGSRIVPARKYYGQRFVTEKRREEKSTKNYSFPSHVFSFRSFDESNACTRAKRIFSPGKVDSLKTFHSFEDAIYNDLPLIASDAGRLRDGSPAQEERFSVRSETQVQQEVDKATCTCVYRVRT